MKNTTLDTEQIKELADYIAKRNASNITSSGEINKFIEVYIKTYDEAFLKIQVLNKKES